MPRPSLPREPSSKRVVLLVEDEPFVRDATCRTLENAGFDVLPAGDAPEAMKLYERRRGNIDLLMTDMTLPGRSGRQLSQDLRLPSVEIPVLLTSGYIENERDQLRHEPRTYFLPKPYTRTELVAMMGKIFDAVPRRRSATPAS